MCGLTGMLGRSFTKDEPNIFDQMLRTLNIRGTDGTGMVRIVQQGQWNSDNFKYTTWKKDVNSLEGTRVIREMGLLEEQKTDPDPMKRENLRALMGHVRHATTGSKRVKHMHPFKVGDTLLMHNGTIESYKLNKNQLDSYHLAKQVEDLGIQKALEELDDDKDSYALQFVNTKANTISFIRNSKRSLYFAKIQGSMLVWSSEKMHIEWICDRLGKSINALEKLPTHHLYTVNVKTTETTMQDLSSVLGKKKVIPINSSTDSQPNKESTPSTTPMGTVKSNNIAYCLMDINKWDKDGACLRCKHNAHRGSLVYWNFQSMEFLHSGCSNAKWHNKLIES